jgi:anti-sigma factor RsiW
MNPCTRFEDLLDELVDGALAPADRRAVEDHVARCAHCRDGLEARRTLARQVAGLPRSIDPPRDLLPSIRERARARRARTPSFALRLAAAAALATVALAGIVGYRMGARRAATPAGSLATLEATEQEYARAVETLTAVLDGRLDALTPEARTSIRENLDVLDRAIDELRAQLDADPSNVEAGRSWNALQRQKIRVLRSASRLSS